MPTETVRQTPAAPTAPVRRSSAHDDDLDTFAGDRSFVMSFARGVSVIQAFAHTSRPLSIAELSHRVHFPRAAVRRLLHTLSEMGYVRMVGARYQLTPKILMLGNAFSSSNDVTLRVQPIVNRLAERQGSFAALVVPEADQTMLMCLAGTSIAGVAQHLVPRQGNQAPMYASASGLLFLSEYTEPQLEAYFARVAMSPITFRTQTTPQQIREALRRVRAQGYSICDRAFADNLRSAAVPVRDGTGAVAAAMVCVQVFERMTEEALRESVLPALAESAAEAARHFR